MTQYLRVTRQVVRVLLLEQAMAVAGCVCLILLAPVVVVVEHLAVALDRHLRLHLASAAVRVSECCGACCAVLNLVTFLSVLCAVCCVL